MSVKIKTIILVFLSSVIWIACQQKEQTEDKDVIRRVTQELLQARASNTLITPVSVTYSNLSLREAYAVQISLAEELSKSFGPVTGYKLGYADSSALKSNNLNIPAYGPIFKNQIKQSGDTIPAKDFHDFSVENEIVFKIAGTIDTKINSVDELIPYVQSVHIGFDMSEGIFEGKTSVVDFVANGAGSKYFVLSEGLDPATTDVKDVLISVVNDADSVVYQGSSSNVLGNPWFALKDIANDLAERGIPLKDGDVIFSGKLAPAYKIAAEKAAGIFRGQGDPFPNFQVVVK
jgi:2-keto-4-pentenoate hydratase